MSTISRRAFLKTVGVGALSVAAMSVLAGCEAGTTTEEVVTGTVKGEAGVSYPVANKYIVSVTDCNYAGQWGAEAKKKLTSWAVTSTEDEKKAMKADAELAGKIATPKDLDVAAVTLTIANYDSNDLAVAPSSDVTAYTVSNADKIKSNSTVITASYNGQTLPCAVNVNSGAAAVIKANSTTPVSVVCTVAVPTNAKEFTLTVALSGGKAVVYTIENENYIDWSKDYAI